MKKILIMSAVLFLLPFTTHAALMGFLDGNRYDQSTGEWKCLYLMDGNCYDKDQKILETRPKETFTPAVTIPESTPQTTYVPVYVSTPAAVVQVPVAGAEPVKPQLVVNDDLIPNVGAVRNPIEFAYSRSEHYISFCSTGTGKGDVVWNGQTVLSNGTNAIAYTTESGTFQPGERSCVIIYQDLVNGQRYSFDYIYNGQIATKHFLYDAAAGIIGY